MENKKVYVKFCDRIECIEFNKDAESEGLKGNLKNKFCFFFKLKFCFFSIRFI